MRCALKNLPENVFAYASPGALAIHNEDLYINRNYIVGTDMDLELLLFVLVKKQNGVVYADIDSIPGDIDFPVIDNYDLIRENFLPLRFITFIEINPN